MKHCINCGTKLDIEDKFCGSCGNSMDEKKTEPLNESDPSEAMNVLEPEKVPDSEENETPQRKGSFKKIIVALASLLVLLILGLFILPKTFFSAEEIPLTLENVSGYWISTDPVEDSEEMVYIDNEHVAQTIIESTGIEIFLGYWVLDTDFDEEENRLEILFEDGETEHSYVIEHAESKDTIAITYNDRLTTEYTRSSLEEYQQKSSFNVKETMKEKSAAREAEEEEAEEVEEINSSIADEEEKVTSLDVREVTLENVTGFYVRRNSNGLIDTIYQITEDYVGLIGIHPVKYSVVSYQIAKINDAKVEEDTLVLDVHAVEHHAIDEPGAIHEPEYHEFESSLVFDLDQKPLELYFNGAVAPYEAIELATIYEEFEDQLIFEPDVYIKEVYENKLLEVGELQTEEELTTSNDSSKTQSSEKLWGHYVYEEKTSTGMLRYKQKYLIPISDVDQIETYEGVHLDKEDFQREGIIGINYNYTAGKVEKLKMDEIAAPGLITAVDYDASQQMFIIEMKYELEDPTKTYEYRVREDGAINYSHLPEQVYKLETNY